jgi:hypothetical protein
MRWFISIGVKYYVVYRNSLTNMVRSSSIYQPEKGDGEREFNQCHIISRQRKNKTFAEEQQGLQAREEEDKEVIILSYNKGDENITNGEQKRRSRSRSRKRTVLICDDERDLLLMFAIELRTKYNVLAAFQKWPFRIFPSTQCTMNGATKIANIVVAINVIRKSRSRVIFISKSWIKNDQNVI